MPGARVKDIKRTKVAKHAKVADVAKAARATRGVSNLIPGEPHKPRIVRVGITQMACTENAASNLTRQIQLIEKAAAAGAQVICTQELFRSQYFCQVEDHRFFALAEPIPGPSTDALSSIAKQHGVAIVASLFEKRAAGLYHNTAAIIDADGSVLGVYRKMHIPDDPLYYEKFYFTPGDTGFKSWKTRHATIGVLICWDQWFPEGARLTAMQGAEILFYPTAIGWHASEKREFGRAQHDSWELIQRSHAVANGCFVCAPNRVGHEIVKDSRGKPVNPDGIEFWGQSFIASPDGAIMRRAPVSREQVILADCDLARVEFSRTHWPFLRDRRVDAYQDLTKRFIER
ncbi:MAG TPA: carbon-nitrogen hydrolase [Vicinamibacterales bacterium]|nr:carbon-nitrogen hydrolase [Vicinamibacterales bacterium]